MAGIRYGGDYNPEQWPEEVRLEDAALMREAGVNTVTVGVFAWSSLEPSPGAYDFGWLDETMDRMAAAGIGVVLATPTASPPPWLGLAHPEALTVDAAGVRLSHGSRDTYCVSSPAYRSAARDIAARLAGRYAGHPALIMWHVHNEYGTACHCDLAADRFRRWLEDRYGSVEALNDAWTTAFWSQGYTAWEQILPPRATRYLPNPAQVLDFRRFTSDELLGAYAEQRDLLKAATPGIPVTTNFVLGGWVPVDHARWAREVDVVAIDHYPTDAGPAAEEQAAFAFDQARGWARGGPGEWMLMETAPNLIYTPGRMHTKEPGRMARQALDAVARGARGVLYFQWRAPRGGAELFHSALVPHAGPDSRVFREAVELGALLADAAPAEVTAAVAVVHDEPSGWALRAPGLPVDGLDAADEALRAHRELCRLGVAVDVIGDLRLLPAYRMVVLPMHHLMSDDQAESLRAWVAAGGRLVVTFLSGVADLCGRIRTGGGPGALRDLLGIRVEDFVPPGEPLTLDNGWTADLWAETVHARGAEVVARYPGGGPAVTRHAVGAGIAWYVSTRLTTGYGDLLESVLEPVHKMVAQ